MDEPRSRIPLPSRTGPLLRPLQEFLRLEAAGGLVLMATAALAMCVANSPLRRGYEALLGTTFEIRFGEVGLAKPLLLWVNDGLMAVFFFLVGMELKREVLEGHLSSLRRASLPAFAAVGGMVAPAAIYVALNRHNGQALHGWAIPTATDIAFALGVLALLGRRVPPALKALLLSVAIFDDLGAILVIAIFYSAKLSLLSLGLAAAIVIGLACLNRMNVRRPAAYILLGVPLWVAMLKSGVHATLAGVVLAMFIPLRVPPGAGTSAAPASPLRRLEHTLHPWVAYGVLPVFALANAGVPILGLSLTDAMRPIPLGIAAGLFVGKQLGVLAICRAAVALRLASLPEGVGWGALYGAALLCGIGFTMSLFIASLAFEPGDTAVAGLDRLGIVVGSVLSAVAGLSVLLVSLRSRTADGNQDEKP